MIHKLLILSTFASLAATLPLWAAENSGSTVAPPLTALRSKVICRGVQHVPITADAGQVLPMQVVSQLACGEDVAILSDSQGYTVQIRTADGKTGYVARMYLSEAPAKSALADRADEAVVDNGIARWRAGTPGSNQFFSGDSLVESLTANGITVQVSLQDTGWKLRASVAIVNQSAEPLDFNPAVFTLDELKPRLRSLAVQNPKELSKALTHQVYWTNSSATAPASATYRNVAYKTPAYVPAPPNYMAQEAQQVQTSVLQAATLAPKDKISGVVWFQRDKNAQELNLRIFVGDQIFEFPLSFPPHN
ncbi:MAG TPA: SH3 domain-containing protein [Candidatus Acidoferrum sp.]|nr:SH3 domain-containing protein [Candidatus Acidoferrum sp.]